MEGSSKISFPPEIRIKSVKVPPVLMPGLKIDSGDILHVACADILKILNCTLRIPFPGQGLKICLNEAETMKIDFLGPCKVGGGQPFGCNPLKPFGNSLAFFS